MAKRPNLLLITCDQWRGECLSAAGHPVVKTPHADALAAEGVLFRRHYAGAAPCAPARACLYTGLYQMTNRVCRNGTPLDMRHGNIALFARRLGYAPTLFGYSDSAPDPRLFSPSDPVLTTYEGVLAGFTARQLLPEHQRPWLSWLAAQGVDASAGFPWIHRPVGGGGGVTNAPPAYSKDETPAAFIAQEFIRWLSEQDTGWFAHLSFLSPHPPFVVPEPYNAMYDPADGPQFRRAATRDAEQRIHPSIGLEFETQRKENFVVGQDGKVADWDDAAFRQIRVLYYGMISEVDTQLGRVFSSLRNSGQWDDTIVILTSDHAEMMGDHFMLGKGGFFDGSYHVPLIIRDPGRREMSGRKVEAFTEAVDILPTVLDLLGGKIPAHLDGRSLVPFLSGEHPTGWRDAAHWEFDFRSITAGIAERHFGISSRQCNLAVVRTERFKYAHFGGGLPPVLFDLADDPAETVNLAEDPAYQPVRVEMAERLLAWRAEHLDQSLALSELTEGGVAGEYHALP
ncbi:alkaline phosphatase family protein [Mesorhizobium sp. BAC0120]|uniref:alkaline phosphatase family protein n=1 Tax=Mesorhizobium sp. BAC0120 TaxID=3090670 RepID=UPI00298BE8FD|nr:alkaline phosphatase family protein [Mesorhizobium sp. BAC0120]MDW6021700.1 alkaline phosphatase family protein [Mesorhizobium sp. BAC0120]